MRGRAWLPGGRAGRDAGAAAGPLGLALERPPAGAQSPSRLPLARARPPAAQRQPNSGGNSPAARAPAPPRPQRKGKRQPLLRGLAPFNSGVQGVRCRLRRAVPSGEGSSPPLPPHLRRSPRQRRGGGERTFKSPVATELAGPDRTPQRLRRVAAAARRSPERSSGRAASPRIPSPLDEEAGGEEQKERGRTAGEGSAEGERRARPATGSARPALSARPAPPPPPRTAPSHTLRQGRPAAPLSTSTPQQD